MSREFLPQRGNNCQGAGLPTQYGRCSVCDRFAPIGVPEGSAMPAHSRARVLTDGEVLAQIPRFPWESAQEKAMATVVAAMFKEGTNGK